MTSGWTTNPQIASNKLDDYIKPSMGVEVGILKNAQDYPAQEGDATHGASFSSKVVEVAAFHELDSKSRYNKWLYKSILADENTLTKEMIKTLKKAEDDIPKRKRLMDEFGQTVVVNVQKAIERRDVGLPKNRAATLESKQGSVPMIDTGHLISVIDSKVYTDA